MERRDSAEESTIHIPVGRASVLFSCGGHGYARSFDRIQKGLKLAFKDTELAGEGTGFGVPMVKLGYETIFPGYANVIQQRGGKRIRVNYHLNLVQRLRRRNSKRLEWSLFYRVTEWFSRLHRKFPVARGLISESGSFVRRIFGLTRAFEETAIFGTVTVTYSINSRQGLIVVDVDLSELPKRRNMEIVIANEQGAGHFDSCCDSNGAAQSGNAIGTWEEVLANEASFQDRRNGVAFSLGRLPGARLFRGRELAGGSLAWAGLDYVLLSHPNSFSYDIRIGKAAKE